MYVLEYESVKMSFITPWSQQLRPHFSSTLVNQSKAIPGLHTTFPVERARCFQEIPQWLKYSWVYPNKLYLPRAVLESYCKRQLKVKEKYMKSIYKKVHETIDVYSLDIVPSTLLCHITSSNLTGSLLMRVGSFNSGYVQFYGQEI